MIGSSGSTDSPAAGYELRLRTWLAALLLGAVGGLVPVVPLVSGLLLWFFPPLGLVVLAWWAWETRRQRRRGCLSPWRWAVVTWFLLVGPLWLLVTIAFLPPGASLPQGDDGVRTVGIVVALTAAGSALLALLVLRMGIQLAGTGHAGQEEPPSPAGEADRSS